MQKKFWQIILMSAMIYTSILNVNAKELSNTFCINDSNVSFSKEEYDFISKMYYEGYQKYVTPDEYKMIFSLSSPTDKVESSTYYMDDGIHPLATFHSTSSKSITIAKSCNSTCLISIVARWLKSPNVRSYDLMGAYLDRVELVDTPITKAVNSTGINISYDMVSNKEGFGYSVPLLTTGDDMQVSQTFRVTNQTGRVFASYQHAAKKISLADSKKYTISFAGYGNVFLFNSDNIREHYDGMAGVYVTID